VSDKDAVMTDRLINLAADGFNELMARRRAREAAEQAVNARARTSGRHRP
jgi:hypothetical protein